MVITWESLDPVEASLILLLVELMFRVLAIIYGSHSGKQPSVIGWFKSYLVVMRAQDRSVITCFGVALLWRLLHSKSTRVVLRLVVSNFLKFSLYKVIKGWPCQVVHVKGYLLKVYLLYSAFTVCALTYF